MAGTPAPASDSRRIKARKEELAKLKQQRAATRHQSAKPAPFQGPVGSEANIAHIRRAKVGKLPDPVSLSHVQLLGAKEKWSQAHAMFAELEKHADAFHRHASAFLQAAYAYEHALQAAGSPPTYDNLSIFDALSFKLLWSFRFFQHITIAEIQDMLLQKLVRLGVHLELMHAGRRLEIEETLASADVRPSDGLYAELRPALVLTSSTDGTAKISNIECGNVELTLINRRYLQCHDDTVAVTAAASSADGLCIVTGSDDGVAMLWSAEDGMSMIALPRHSGTILSVAFSADARLVATASSDRTAKVSEAQTGCCLLTLAEHQDAVRSVAFSPENYILTASDDRTAKVWNRRHGNCTVTAAGHSDTVMAVACSPGYMVTFATGSQDTTVRIWSATNGKSMKVLRGHAGAVASVVYSRDGKLLASGSADHSAKLWDVKKGDCVRTILGHSEAITSVAFSLDRRYLALGSVDCSLSVWSVRSGEVVRKFEAAHHGKITSVMFTCPPGWDAFSKCSKAASTLFSRLSRPRLWPTWRNLEE